MKYKSTLVLFVLVVIAGIVAFSLSRRPTSEELEKQRSKLLPGLKTEDVQALTVEQGDRRIVCSRDAKDKDEWRISEPVDVRADRYAVEDVIRKLSTAERQGRAAREGLDLAAYGLSEPKRTVTLQGEGKDAQQWKIMVGGDAPAAGSVWVAVEGAPAIYSVKKDVVDKTDVDVAGLRSKDLGKRISTWDLKKVAVSAGADGDKPALDLVCQKADSKWEIRQPFVDLGSGQDIEALVNKVYDHRIKPDEFIVDDARKAPDYGLDTPDLTVTVASGDRTDTFLLSRRAEGENTVYYAMQKGENPVVRVPESLFEALRPDPGTLRDKSLVDFRADDVAHIKLAQPAGELLIDKGDEGWQIGGDKPVPADAGVVKSFLDDLKEAKVKEFAANQPEDLAAFGLDKAARSTLTLTDKDGKDLAELTLGGKVGDEGVVYARRGDYPGVLELERKPYLKRVEHGRLAFLDRTIVNEKRTEAAELRLVRGTDKFLCKYDAEHSLWQLAEPVSGEADTSACQLIAGDFAPLKAAAFAAEKAEDPAHYGLAEPAIMCTVTFRSKPTDEKAQPEERVRTLQIGTRTADPTEGYYARLDGDDRVFVLPEAKVKHFEENLASKYISRSWGLRKVTFHKGDKELVLTYDPKEDVWRDAEGNELAKDVAERMRDARSVLAGFRGDRVADYIVKSPALYGFDKPYLAIDFDEETTKGKSIVIGNEVDGGGRYARGPASGFVQVARDEDVETLVAVIEPPAKPEESAGQAPEQPEAEAGQPAAQPVPELRQPPGAPQQPAAERPAAAPQQPAPQQPAPEPDQKAD